MKNSIHNISAPNYDLRTFLPGDANDVQQFLEVNKDYMLPWIPWAVDEPETVKAKKQKIAEWTEEYEKNEKFTYGIYQRESQQLAGMIQLFTRQGPDVLEIGYITGENYAGKGVATLSSYVMTRIGFEHLGIPKMVIHCDVGNYGSKRVPEKLNYKLEKIHTESEGPHGNTEQMIWTMLKDDFRIIDKYEPLVFD